MKDDELAPFPELANEKTLKKFLSACLEGGEHRERSLGYFKVAKLDWKKAEKFELVFNPECIPAPEPSKEERQKWDDHCTSPMSGSSLAYKTSGEPPLPPGREITPGKSTPATRTDGRLGQDQSVA